MSTARIQGASIEVTDEHLSYERLVSGTVESVRRERATSPAAASAQRALTARAVIESVFLDELPDLDREAVCRVVMWTVAGGLTPMLVAGIPVPDAVNALTTAALEYGGHLPQTQPEAGP